MKALEANYGCSAICQNALFWFTKDITTAPKKACASEIIKQVGAGFTIPGVVVMFSACLVLIIFFYQYCLWCEKPEDDKWNN